MITDKPMRKNGNIQKMAYRFKLKFILKKIQLFRKFLKYALRVDRHNLQNSI